MEYRLFIDGIWQLSESGQTYTNVDPANPDESWENFRKEMRLFALWRSLSSLETTPNGDLKA